MNDLLVKGYTLVCRNLSANERQIYFAGTEIEELVKVTISWI
ncbi:MAG: hypothetical protein AAGD96_15255 [Chloroflexota bacterium]